MDARFRKLGDLLRLRLNCFSQYVSQYAEALLMPLRGFEVHLLLEPGRSIVGPAGALVTAVLYRKTNNSKKFLIVDAGMNDLLRPSLIQRLSRDRARRSAPSGSSQ